MPTLVYKHTWLACISVCQGSKRRCQRKKGPHGWKKLRRCIIYLGKVPTHQRDFATSFIPFSLTFSCTIVCLKIFFPKVGFEMSIYHMTKCRFEDWSLYNFTQTLSWEFYLKKMGFAVKNKHVLISRNLCYLFLSPDMFLPLHYVSFATSWASQMHLEPHQVGERAELHKQPKTTSTTSHPICITSKGSISGSCLLWPIGYSGGNFWEKHVGLCPNSQFVPLIWGAPTKLEPLHC